MEGMYRGTGRLKHTSLVQSRCSDPTGSHSQAKVPTGCRDVTEPLPGHMVDARDPSPRGGEIPHCGERLARGEDGVGDPEPGVSFTQPFPRAPGAGRGRVCEHQRDPSPMGGPPSSCRCQTLRPGKSSSPAVVSTARVCSPRARAWG